MMLTMLGREKREEKGYFLCEICAEDHLIHQFPRLEES
jgi:hypothetical protein